MSRVPALRSGLITDTTDGELVVLDTVTGTAHLLKGAAADAFHACSTGSGEVTDEGLTALASAGLLDERPSRRLLLQGAAVAVGAGLVTTLSVPTPAAALSGGGGGGGGGGLAGTPFSYNFEGLGPYTNGGGAFNTYLTNATFGPFTVTAGSVDVVSAGFYGGNTSAVLDSFGNQPGTVSTTSYSAAPASYTVSIEVTQNTGQGASPTDTVTLTLGNATATITPSTSFGNPQTILLTVGTAGPLTITGNGSGASGPLVDNIVVTPLT